VDNTAIAFLLSETADLMSIDGADSFRILSYRRAAEAVEQTTVDLMAVVADTDRLLEISGIGKSMAANIQSIASTGSLPQRDQLVTKYGTGILELLKLPGMGPKTIALFWSAAQITSIDQLAEAI
jgi:DNA polymerase (family X)